MKKLRNESERKPEANQSMESFLGEGTIMTGTLKFPGNLTYHGHFKGKIISEGKLIVGETGELDSEISVAVALNSGEIRGSIDASEKVQILPYGKIVGNVRTPNLQIESGAVFNGKSEMPATAPQVHATEKKPRKNNTKQNETNTKAQTQTSPVTLSKKNSNYLNSKTLFPILSLAAVLGIIFGAGLLKKHLFSPPVSEEIINTSGDNETLPLKEKAYGSEARNILHIPPNAHKEAKEASVDPMEKPATAKIPPRRSIPKKTNVRESKKSQRKILAVKEPSKKKRVPPVKKEKIVKIQASQKRRPPVSEVIVPPPIDVNKLKNLAGIQISKGQTNKAIDTLKEILEVSPLDAKTNLKLSRLYFNAGYRELADIQFAKQEKLDPQSVVAVINEGFRQFSKKNNQKALSIFKRALFQEPSNIRAKYGLAAVYSKQNFHKKAKQICISTLKSTPGIIPFENELAWLNNKKKRPRRSISLSRL